MGGAPINACPDVTKGDLGEAGGEPVTTNPVDEKESNDDGIDLAKEDEAIGDADLQ